MPKLVVKFRDAIQQEIPVNKSCITIGRTKENDVVINNLGVSREHARIIQDGEDYILEDLGSQNGVLVNNVETKHVKLQDKDDIVIGKHSIIFFKYENVDPNKAPARPGIDAMPPGETLKMGQHPTKRMDKPEPGKPAVESRKVGVQILEGGVDQNTVEFHHLLIIAGQGSKVDIRIKGQYDKDVVFVISNRPAGFFISPPKGISLKVNGQDVSDYIQLKNDDIIQAAETKMKFFLQ